MMDPEDRGTLTTRRGDVLVAVLIAAGTLALLASTLQDYGMAWDEGFTVEREERLGEWFARVAGNDSPSARAWSPFLSMLERRNAYIRRAGADLASPWSRESLRFYWQFAREEPSGHPPFYALLGLAGRAISSRVLPTLESYRFGPAALFALTIGAVYWMMARNYGRVAGAMAALSLLTMPRVFAHAHLASYDAPTLSFWFLAASAFLEASGPAPAEGQGRDRALPWTIAFGVAWGCAAATKLTGWFIPVPLAAWALLYRDRRAARALVIGGVVAALMVYATNPTWWGAPVAGVRAFLDSNLGRHSLRPIPTQFFGRIYRFSLPWYNTLAWTAIVVPPMTLALALVGIARIVRGRFRDRAGTLLLGCWAFFMLLRALPNAPGHDGERQFLAAFAFLACLAGVGLAAIGAWLGRVAPPGIARGLTVATLAVVVFAGAWSTWRTHPLQLSYYNVLIGGLSGATKAGLEPTYYWEAVTPDVRDWINEHTEPGQLVAFIYPAVTFEYLHRWGLLRPSPLARLPQNPRWFVVMNRPGHLRSFDRTLGQYLLDHARPAFVKTLPEAPDVPLIAIFSGEDAIAADRLLKQRAEGKDRETTAPSVPPTPSLP